MFEHPGTRQRRAHCSDPQGVRWAPPPVQGRDRDPNPGSVSVIAAVVSQVSKSGNGIRASRPGHSSAAIVSASSSSPGRIPVRRKPFGRSGRGSTIGWIRFGGRLVHRPRQSEIGVSTIASSSMSATRVKYPQRGRFRQRTRNPSGCGVAISSGRAAATRSRTTVPLTSISSSTDPGIAAGEGNPRSRTSLASTVTRRNGMRSTSGCPTVGRVSGLASRAEGARPELRREVGRSDSCGPACAASGFEVGFHAAAPGVASAIRRSPCA